ncbi:hypothetical protein uvFWCGRAMDCOMC449_015 [Freshwater phage uvFW-CGR-AMD-COM-C449]|jgi:hypothetical protein|nr:hypothetical protein uvFWCGRAMDCOMC449_015 [Freshwater phage uvFW-CGR-AMD-COM-C449]
MSISNYAELALLDTLRNTSFAVAATYVKLHTGDAGEAGTSNAASETTRKAISFSAASSGSMASSATVEWTNVAATETYSHWSLWDASTAGNCLWTGALSTSAAVTAGDTFQITSLTLSLD